MKTNEKEAIIKNYKDTLMLYGFGDSPLTSLLHGDRDTIVNAKEEMMSTIFSKDEIRRFKNEARVYDNPRAIKGVSEFEEMLHEVGTWYLIWDAEGIEEAFQLYVKYFKDEEKKERFSALAERAKYIINNMSKVRLESVDEMDVNLLNYGDLIKITSENEDNKGDYYHKCKFSVGKTYKVVNLGDGFMLEDDENDPYHISEVETYYHLELV